MRHLLGRGLEMTNRTICSIFDEMRSCQKTHNYSYLGGLIEEAQSAANRMEAALYDKSDLDFARAESSKLRHKNNKLRQENEKLEKTNKKLKGKDD